LTNAAGLLVLLLGLGGIAATAALVALALRPEGTTWFLLATYVLASAEVLLILQLLSLVHLVRGPVIVLVEALLLAGAAQVWWRAGAPRPSRPPLGWLRDEWVVAALAAVVATGLVYELFIVLTTPPNNWDSLAYHLPRAVEWFQRHAVEYIPNAPTERMNAFQPNAEILILYVMAVAHNDLLVELPQWLAGVAVLVAVYGIARRAGAERPAAAFAGLLTLTLTEFALESVTTQNDLVAAAFVAAAAYFALGDRRTDTALAGIALGAALGTKLTVALALPAVVLLAFAAGRARRVLQLGLASAVAFLAIGFYGFGLNLVETGKLLGDAPEATALQPDRTLRGTVSTMARVGFDTIDLSGYHPERSRVERIERLGQSTFERLHVPVNPPESTLTTFQFSVNTLSEEDNSYFGPLGWLLLAPLCLVVLVLGALRRVRPVWTILAVSLPLYVLGVALAYRYNLWIGRFMLTAGALSMPLVALLYRWRLVAGLVAVVGAATLYVAHAHNDTKPTGRDQSTPVWRMNRAEAIAVRQGSMLKTLTTTDQVIPDKARILAVVGENDFVYALYGPHLNRRVFTVHTQDVGWPKWPRLLRKANDVRAAWLLVNGTIPIGHSNAWESVSYFDDDGWTLLRRR
jgi:4-amino-4-deoxy-L-arabinose transferase-like glycosyltransferase